MNRLKSIDWLDRVLYPLAVILMEACWVYPWLVWMGFWSFFERTSPVLSLVSVIVVLLVSRLATGVSSQRDWPLWLIRVIVIGSGLVIIFLVLRIEYSEGYAFFDGGWFGLIAQLPGTIISRLVLALMVMAYLWWRGMALERATLSFSNVYRPFLRGLVALIALLVVWQISSNTGATGEVMSGIGSYVMAFFFFGLMAIAICHIHQVQSGMAREDTTMTSTRRWLLTMLGMVGVILVVGLVVAGLFSADIFTGLGVGISTVYGAILKVLDYVFIPIGYLIAGFFYLFRLLMNRLLEKGLLNPIEPSGEPEATPPPDTTLTHSLPPEVTLIIKWILLALIVAAVVFFLVRAVKRYRVEHTWAGIEELHESLWSWGGFKGDLRLFLSMLGQKFRKKAAPAEPPGYYIDDDLAVRRDIRELYRHLLYTGASSGLAHLSHETAVEYSERLGKAVPDSREPVGRLTDIYNEVRYGEIKAREEQVDRANGLWRVIHGLLRRIRRE
jgi:hypothetical protein